MMDKTLAKAKFDRGTKMIKAGLDLMDEYMEMIKDDAEIPLQKIKEGKIECERRGMYHERPHVQLQPGDYRPLSFEQPKAREGDKHKGK